MQSLAVLLVVAAVFGSASASLYAPNQCIVFDHIDNDQVQCSGEHPVSACHGPNGCSSITASRDCPSAICCCSRSKQSVNRRLIEDLPLPPAEGPVPELAPAGGPLPTPLPTKPVAPCEANITYGSSWEEDGEWLNSLNINLSNNGPTPIVIPYTVVISKAGWSDVIQSWNWEASVEERNFVTGNFTYGSWQDILPLGTSNSYFGFIVKSTENEFVPQDFLLNGVNCEINS